MSLTRGAAWQSLCPTIEGPSLFAPSLSDTAGQSQALTATTALLGKFPLRAAELRPTRCREGSTHTQKKCLLTNDDQLEKQGSSLG